MRSIACFGAALAAVLLALPLSAGAQQPAQVKRPAPAPAPAARYASQRDTLNQNTVTVISGNPNGTYLYLAYDMSAVLDDGNDLRILPVIGKGGYQNVMDVLHLRGVDLCITQSNIMTYLKRTGEMGPNIENRLAFITRLYNEEMHVLAGPGINNVKELDGKKVNFSDVGSGTQFSTRLIFDLLGIKATEINVGQADGYQMVKSGEIAATVLIAGKPTGSFAKFKIEPGMKLLPVPYTEVLEQDYFPGQADLGGLSGPHRKGPVSRYRRGSLRARRLQLAARHGPLPPCGHLHRCVLREVPRVPEAGAARQMARSEYQLRLEGLEAFPCRRGMAGEESRAAIANRQRCHRSRHRTRPGRQGCAQRSRCSGALVPGIHGVGEVAEQAIDALSNERHESPGRHG